jgi:hypothetical protein
VQHLWGHESAIEKGAATFVCHVVDSEFRKCWVED